MIQLTTFKTDVTPGVGHPLCAGWMQPALGIADPIYASGIILKSDADVSVLCAVDWCEISNRSHIAWRRKLADAAQTTPERVMVHCVHPHCTPWPDEYAQRLVGDHSGIAPLMDVGWCDNALNRVADAARAAMSNFQPVTHLKTGRGLVEKVASNRRIMGSDGKIKAIRWTTTKDAEVRAEPEGLIDPWLKTISFWNRDSKLAALHYYAVHPSSYEDRFVSPDFVGLAREQRIAEEDGVPHLYFTECAGNITAGKYNDGARENRQIFTSRIHQAMLDSERDTDCVAAADLRWSFLPVQLPPLESSIEPDLQAILQEASLPSKARSCAALKLAYLERANEPIGIAALHLNESICLLHLPGEAFIEYQLFAQAQRPDAFVVAPSYGDCGPGYICMEKSFDEGGYEPRDSFVAGKSELILKNAIAQVMKRG